MKLVSRDYVLSVKEEKRKNINIEYHANGECVHTGKISFGCKNCFKRTRNSFYSVYTGVECNCNCPVCYHDPHRTDENSGTIYNVSKNLSDLYEKFLIPEFQPEIISYNSNGETLKYMYILKEAREMLDKFRPNNHCYTYLYTNGVLANQDILDELKDLKLNEMRFHLSASNFSKKAIDNLKNAAKMGFIVSVEEPGIPENKDKLMSLFPMFEDIGLKHLNIIEPRVTKFNYDYLNKKYPEGLLYQDYLWAMYDDGMTYDFMSEKLKNNYGFSVLDCNCRTEFCRSSISTELLDSFNLKVVDPMESIEDAINKNW